MPRAAGCAAVVVLWAIVGCDERPRQLSTGVGVELAVRDAADIGRYLSDVNGRAVYVRIQDRDGTSSCVEDCAAAWPPVPGSRPPVQSNEPAVQPELIDAIARADGVLQATYAKRPLYYRERTEATSLERSVSDRWGTWSLVFPHGEPMVR